MNNYYSLSQLLSYESYDPETALFYNKKSVGFILEAAPLTGTQGSDIKILSTLIADSLPNDCDLQFLLWASNKIGPVLDEFVACRTKNNKDSVLNTQMIKWLAEKRHNFLKCGTKKSLSKNTQLLLRDFKLYLILSFPSKKAKPDELLSLREQLISTLESIQMASQKIPIENFLSFMRDLVNPSDEIYPSDCEWNPYRSLSEQITNNETQLITRSHSLDFNSELTDPLQVHCFNIQDFPKQYRQWEMAECLGQLFNQSLQLPCPTLTSLHIRLIDHDKSMAHAQMQTMNKESKVRSPLAKFMPSLQREFKDWEFVRDRLSNGDRLVKTFFQVILYAKKSESSQSERKIRDLYRSNGWKLMKPAYLQLQSWLAALPMMMSEGLYHDLKLMGRLHTMTAFNAVNLAPVQADWKGTQTASLILPSRRGQISLWNPFDSKDGNYNIAIAARSGSGKSVFTQEYIVSLLGLGGRVWVIDAGYSYQKTVELLGGEFIVFNQEKPISLNVFTHIRDFDNEALPLLKPLLCSMARPDSKVSREEANFIEQALKAAWSIKGTASSITTVVDYLKEQAHPICKNLVLLLYPYTSEGMYGRYFEKPCNIAMDNQFIVIELQELKSKKELQKIVLLVMMYQITQSMYSSDRRQIKSCIIDEAWDLLGGNNDSAAEFIETGYRTARRFRGNFVTITQSINDYYQNSVSIAAYENSDHNVILAQKAETLTKLKQSGRLDIDEHTEALYKSLKLSDTFSECIIKGPSGLSIHRILLDPFSRILYSSKGEEFTAVNELVASGKSLQEAVTLVAKAKYHESF